MKESYVGNPQDSKILEAYESLTQEAKFQQDEECCKSSGYIQAWVEYANLVRDANAVYEYMIANKIGDKDAKVHINLALH